MFNQTVGNRKPDRNHKIDIDRTQKQIQRYHMAAQDNVTQQQATDPEQEQRRGGSLVASSAANVATRIAMVNQASRDIDFFLCFFLTVFISILTQNYFAAGTLQERTRKLRGKQVPPRDH